MIMLYRKWCEAPASPCVYFALLLVVLANLENINTWLRFLLVSKR